MIRFGIRLALGGGREAITRLLVVTAAVTLGVGMLLVTVAGINAVGHQDQRFAWLNTGNVGEKSTASASADPLWWNIQGDYYDGQTIGRIDLAATGPDSPVPPGIPALPAPGQFYASPAMSALLARTPADQLADRFPGKQVGTIGAAGLPSPESLIIVIGRTPAELSATDAEKVTSIATQPPNDCDGCYVGTRSSGVILILSVVAGAMLFPVLLFIGAATRLSAARREQRFAAMRLVGATPRQISVISTVESTMAAIIGTALGFALFAAVRVPAAQIPFTGSRFYESDLTLSPVDILLVAIGIPVCAAIAARLSLRRVRISPLGVSRRVTPRPPSALRLIPLVIGVAELFYFIGNRPRTGMGQAEAFLPGFLIIMAGLIIAGPWLTMIGARTLARRSRRLPTLVAARRMADNPQAAFRAISGLVVALFVTTVAVGVITTIDLNRGSQRTGPPATVLNLNFPPKHAPAPSIPYATMVAGLRATPGVRFATTIYANPQPAQHVLIRSSDGAGPPEVPDGLVLCADIAADPSVGHCAPGATVAEVWSDFDAPNSTHFVAREFPTSTYTPDALASLSPLNIVVGTDGSTAAIERARTQLEAAYPFYRQQPGTDDDFNSDTTKDLAGWEQLANVVILASLPIAACGLAVSVAAGLSERKRPFSLLRLTGVPVRMLRSVVALESAVPLLVVAVVAIGAGFAAAAIFLKAQMGYVLTAPPGEYYAFVIAGLVLSLLVIASTLPLLERFTGPEVARND
ncbi:MAG TPA: FtsX-like permease family protein [Micromonosporaceae bacterium]